MGTEFQAVVQDRSSILYFFKRAHMENVEQKGCWCLNNWRVLIGIWQTLYIHACVSRKKAFRSIEILPSPSLPLGQTIQLIPVYCDIWQHRKGKDFVPLYLYHGNF